MSKFLADSNELLRINDKENNPIHLRINPDKPPRNFRDAIKALDKQAWAAAYNSEFLGFKQRSVFKVVKPKPSVRIHDTLTRPEYKEDNGEFLKCKVRLCARGNQQILESASKNPISMRLS